MLFPEVEIAREKVDPRYREGSRHCVETWGGGGGGERGKMEVWGGRGKMEV